MFSRLFPQRIDNDYRGYTIALWLFGIVVLLRTVIGVNSILISHEVATSADGIPVDTFDAEAARAFLLIFALGGLRLLMLSLIGVVVLIRYRAMVPMLFALLVIEAMIRKVIVELHPIVRTRAPGPAMNVALSILMVLGLALSLAHRRKAIVITASCGA